MKKILVFSYYSGISERGVEVWARDLKEKLSDVFDIEIIGGKKGEGFLANVFRNIQKVRYADIVVPTNGRLQVFVLRLLTFFLRKKIIVFGHSGLGADDKWNLLCSPDIFVCFTGHQKIWAERFKFPWTQIVKISHAIDVEKFKFRQVGKKLRKKVVLCVAANEPAKRIELVKSAVSKLTGFKFLVVGKGNEKLVPSAKMPQIYQNAGVFCFVPEKWEAFGLVFLEAMASGLPVVTTDDPIRKEIIGPSGVFVKDPMDANKLAKAILSVYKKDWRDIPQRQSENFSWEKIVPKYIELFNM